MIQCEQKFVIFADFSRNLSLYEMSDSLPYVSNGPIYLFLYEIFSMNVEVDILHNIGVLQD